MAETCSCLSVQFFVYVFVTMSDPAQNSSHIVTCFEDFCFLESKCHSY